VHSASNIPILIQNCIYHHQDDINRTQAIRIPTLKSLTYNFVNNNVHFKKLIKSNPQLEDLTIHLYGMNQEFWNLISINDKITNISIVFQHYYQYTEDTTSYTEENKNFEISKFNSTKCLTLKQIDNVDLMDNQLHLIVKYFPNLTHLTLSMYYSCLENYQLNELLRLSLQFSLIEKLTLELYEHCCSENDYFSMEDDWFKYSEFVIDFSNFSNIRCLILDMDLIPLYSIDFENIPDKLKFIRYLPAYKNDAVKYIEENPKIFRKWNVEFKKEYVYFTR
jgi:hypothetical protein